jgi:hypothetical protein
MVERISRKAVYLGTIGAWLIACAALELPGMAAYARDKPWGDAWFTYTWSFQLMTFGAFRLPLWLLALAIVLALERHFLRRRAATRS